MQLQGIQNGSWHQSAPTQEIGIHCNNQHLRTHLRRDFISYNVWVEYTVEYSLFVMTEKAIHTFVKIDIMLEL